MTAEGVQGRLGCPERQEITAAGTLLIPHSHRQWLCAWWWSPKLAGAPVLVVELDITAVCHPRLGNISHQPLPKPGRVPEAVDKMLLLSSHTKWIQVLQENTWLTSDYSNIWMDLDYHRHFQYVPFVAAIQLPLPSTNEQVNPNKPWPSPSFCLGGEQAPTRRQPPGRDIQNQSGTPGGV